MSVFAIVVLVVMLGVSVWSWSAAPGRRMAEQFRDIWAVAWGKQLMLDFAGLEVILALWMLADARVSGHWVAAIACVVTMPVFGSMSAAAYWLIR
jgi:hypothetical protein